MVPSQVVPAMRPAVVLAEDQVVVLVLLLWVVFSGLLLLFDSLQQLDLLLVQHEIPDRHVVFELSLDYEALSFYSLDLLADVDPAFVHVDPVPGDAQELAAAHPALYIELIDIAVLVLVAGVEKLFQLFFIEYLDFYLFLFWQFDTLRRIPGDQPL